jgi:hypothetical protein
VSDAEIKRRVEAGNALLKALSAGFQEDWAKRQMFPSTTPGDRGATSPLGGTAKQPTTEEKPTTKPKAKPFVW